MTDNELQRVVDRIKKELENSQKKMFANLTLLTIAIGLIIIFK